eukprot:COSAG04_NODE_4054_length_2335_cov_2.029964_2_plen_90_part_00
MRSSDCIQGPEPEEQPRTVAEWLKSLDLEVCTDVLNELGYDKIDLITDGDEEEVADMITAVEAAEGIKKPTAKKFKRELAKLRGKGESL